MQPDYSLVREFHEEAGLLKGRAQCRIHGHRYDEGYDRVDRGGDEVDLQGQIRCRLSEDENLIPVADDRVCKHVEDQTAGSGDDGPAKDVLRIIGLRDAADSVSDEAGDETDEQLAEQCLRYERCIDRIQQITDAHADRTGDTTERTADDERTEYHDGISEVDGCHICTDRNLDLKEGEDCIGKRCEQSGKRELIGFRVIHNVASSGVFRHLPVLPCIIGQN